MKVTEQPFDFPPSPPRTPGLHLSTIVRAIEQDIFGQEKRPDKTPDQERRLMAMWEAGLVWERAIEVAYSERYCKDRPWIIRQGEVEMDGIKLTPDADDPREKQIEEYKWTRVSLNTIAKEGFEKKWPGYLMQMKAYCRAKKRTKALLVVLFVNGDYKWGTTGCEPTPKKYLFEFTKQEIEENWLLILAKKRELERKPASKPAASPFARIRSNEGRGSGGGVTAKDLGLASQAQVEMVPWAPRFEADGEDD